MLLKTLVLVFCVCLGGAQERMPEDKRLDFKSLAEKYGLICEEHDVVTEDGYILGVFHIPGNETKPVLLVHGFANTADDFILRGNTSLVVELASTDYDVWLVNLRGNRYSRRHQTLDPDVDLEYWNFSFHEMGLLDLPATIDYILNKTRQTGISCIAFSQGNLIFYILGSLKPEYNNKVKLLIALAPVAFLYYWEPPIRYLYNVWPIIDKIYIATKQEEVFGENSWIRRFHLLSCIVLEGAYERCVEGIVMPVNGWDLKEVEPEFWYVVARHYPAGFSRKNMNHLLQLVGKKKFSQMDYGEAINLKVYNSSLPPDYDLSKVTMNVALVAGLNDRFAPYKGVNLLKCRLPNVVKFITLKRKRANHADLIWGKHMKSYLYPHIMELLEKYA